MAAVGAVVVGFVLYTGLYLVSPHRGRGVPVRVEMPTSHGADDVALRLYEAHVVDRPWLFAWLLRLTGAVDHVPDGALALRDDLTPRSVLRAIASGRGIIRVTIPEGYTRFDIADRLVTAGILATRDEFITATESDSLRSGLGVHAATLEGYLYPDSYDFTPGMPATEVAERMVRTGRRRLADLRARHAEGSARVTAAGFDDTQLLAFASLVERETGASEDRTHVASVFWNRLTLPSFQPRLLQSDPTVVYGCRVAHPPSCPSVPATGRVPITRAMLDDASNPFNTYRHEGLPPGPIANPGARALEAVLAPADTRDLYFVAMGNGRSAFAATRAEHEANVQRYLRARDAGP